MQLPNQNGVKHRSEDERRPLQCPSYSFEVGPFFPFPRKG